MGGPTRWPKTLLKRQAKMSNLSLPVLKGMNTAQLEALYVKPGEIVVPDQQSFRGHTLTRLNNQGADDLAHLLPQWLLFETMPYGINFLHALGNWFFFEPRIALATFEPRIGRSRWRDTETITMNYHVSILPDPVKDLLYDEIKPIGNGLYLGIGGTNAERGRGDHFFFVLEPV